VRRHFDALSPFYDVTSAKRARFFAREHSIIAQDMRSKGLAAALDVGAGTASRTVDLQRASGARFDCCDISLRMVEISKTKIPAAKQSDMVSLAYPSSAFDAVTCLGYSFSYLPNRRERLGALREFSRVLKAGGTLYIDVANRWHLGENNEYARTLAQNLLKLPFGVSGETFFTVKVGGKRQPGYLHSFRLREMRALLRKAGFRVERVAFIGFTSGEIRQGISKHILGQPLIIARK
jgi:ubiquinone/menaquinone biosynthesis C-methylase UbiE